MFKNIGQKIETFCIVYFILGVLISIILPIVFEMKAIAVIGIAILGTIISYLSVLLLYGFGEIIECNERVISSIDAKNTGYIKSYSKNEKIVNTSTKKTCVHCGAELIEGRALCPECGKVQY